MRLVDAQMILAQVQGRGYTWLKAWGLSIIKEAIYCVEHRKSATPADRERAEDTQRKIWRKW